MQMKMKIISPTEYNQLLSSLILKLFITKSMKLPDDEISILVSEIYVQATLGTNYQECNINDYIKELKRFIQCKCESLPTKNT
ncbi:hypothetical protein [Escherichia phage UB]|uniref:Uncharacterized protein n=1 Tax=Escherichia phage UB TaxID=2268588 RepID=A0A2Z5HBY7_9CAUD|nr:hypothetical protein [Escherichia phage UB]